METKLKFYMKCRFVQNCLFSGLSRAFSTWNQAKTCILGTMTHHVISALLCGWAKVTSRAMIRYAPEEDPPTGNAPQFAYQIEFPWSRENTAMLPNQFPQV